MSQRPVLTPEQRALSYSKYYDLPITPIPAEKVAILEGGPMDPKDALPIERRNDLFQPGYLPGEIGYCVMPDGTGYVANKTEMPGVTPAMFEWWFAWHGLNDMRYRIWDPEDHFYARQQTPEKVLDPAVPMEEKTWGTVHHVLEERDTFFELPESFPCGTDKNQIVDCGDFRALPAPADGPVLFPHRDVAFDSG